MRASPRLPAVSLLLIALVLPTLAHGGPSSWSHDSHTPNPLYNPQFVGDVPDAAASDGAGGVFAFWEDLRNGNRDVFGAHVFADGSLDLVWYFGPGVCTAAGDQTNIRALADGAGGVFVCWSDARSGVTKPYLTHLLANGSPAAGFPTNGLGVETSLPNADGPPQMCLDALGNVQMVWEYTAGAGNQDIYGAQVVGSTVAWMGGLVTTAASQTSPVIAQDSGTMNLAWVESGAIWVGRYAFNTGGPVSQIVSPSNATYTSSSPRIAPAASSGPGGSMVVWLTTNASGTAPAAAFYWAGSISNNLGLIGAQVAGTSYLGDLCLQWLEFRLVRVRAGRPAAGSLRAADHVFRLPRRLRSPAPTRRGRPT